MIHVEIKLYCHASPEEAKSDWSGLVMKLNYNVNIDLGYLAKLFENSFTIGKCLNTFLKVLYKQLLLWLLKTAVITGHIVSE